MRTRVGTRLLAAAAAFGMTVGMISMANLPAANAAANVDPTFTTGISIARLTNTTFRVDGTMTAGSQGKWGSVYYYSTDTYHNQPDPTYTTFEDLYNKEKANPSGAANKAAYIPVPNYSSDTQTNADLASTGNTYTVYLWAAAFYEDASGNPVWSNIAKARFPRNDTSKNVPPVMTATASAVSERTANSATVTFKSNRGPGTNKPPFTYYYRVGEVYANNTPSVTDVIEYTPNYPDHITPIHGSGDLPLAAAGQNTTITVTGLSPAATNLYVVGVRDTDGDPFQAGVDDSPLNARSNVLTIPLGSVDVPTPTLSNPVGTRTPDQPSASFSFNSDAAGTYYYTTGTTPPSVETVKAGTSKPMASGANTFTIPVDANSNAYVVGCNDAGCSPILTISLTPVTVPVLSALSVDDRKESTATLHLTSSQAGTYRYLVADTAPQASDVQTTGQSGSLTTSPATISLINLPTKDTSVWITVQNAQGYWSELTQVQIPEYVAPAVGPVVSDGRVVSRAATAASITFVSDMDGMYSWVVSEEQPTPEDFEYGTMDVMSTGSNKIVVDVLDTNQATVWIIGQSEGEVWGDPIPVPVSACDPATGAFNLQLVSVDRTSETAVKVKGTTDQPGFLIYAPVRDDAADPTVATLQNMMDQSADPYYETGEVTIDYQSDYLLTVNFPEVGQQRVWAIAYNYDEGGNVVWSDVITALIPNWDDTQAPALTADPVMDRTPSSATVSFKSDEGGSYYYTVGTADPTADSVVASGTSAVMRPTTTGQHTNTMNLTGLPATATNVYVVGVDASGNKSSVLTIPIETTVEAVGPVLTPGEVSGRTASAAIVGFTSDLGGTYKYVVSNEDQSVDQIKAGTNGTLKAGPNTIPVTVTTAATKVWIIGQTTDETWGNPITITINPYVTQPGPELSQGALQEGTRTENEAMVEFRTNLAGTYAYVVQSSEPDPETVHGSTNTGPMSTSGMVTIELHNLTADATSVWIAGKNADGVWGDTIHIVLGAVDVDKTPPTLINSKVPERTATAATVTFASTEIGTYAYIVKPSSDPAPVTSDFQSDPTGTGTLGLTNTLPLANLTADATTVYVLAEDAAGNTASIYPIEIPEYVAPAVGPVVSDGRVVSRAATAASITFVSDMDGMYSWVVSEEQPTPEDFEYGTMDVMSTGSNKIVVDVLDTNQATVWIIGQSEGEVWGDPIPVPVSACDPATGAFNLQLVSVDRTSETAVKVKGTTDQPGFLIYAPVRDDAADPTVATLQNMMDQSADPYYETGEVTIDYQSDYLLTVNFPEVGQQRVWAIAYNYDEGGNVVWSDVITALIPNWDDTQAPALTADPVMDRTPSSATVSFKSDEGGSYYYTVGTADPTADSVVASGTSAVMRPTTTGQHTNTMNLTGLPATATNVYVVGVDASGNKSSVLTIPIETTVEAVGPVLTPGEVSGRTASAAIVGFTSDLGGTYKYVVSNEDQSVDQIKAGTNGTLKAGPNTIPVTVTTAATKVWIIGQTTDETWGNPITITINPYVDTTAPDLTVTSQTRDSITKGTVKFTSDSDATVFFMSKRVGDVPPSVEEMKALPASNQMTVHAEVVDNTVTVNTSGGDGVELYLLAIDGAGNESPIVVGHVPAVDKIPPALTVSDGQRLTATDYKFSVTTDLDAVMTYVVVQPGQDVPTDEDVQASNLSKTLTTGITNSFTLSDLASADEATVYAMAYTIGTDGEKYWSPLYTVDIPAFVDTEPVVISNIDAARNGADTGTVTFTTDKAGYVVMIAQSASAAEPTDGDFEDLVNQGVLKDAGNQSFGLDGLDNVSQAKVYVRVYYPTGSGDELIWSDTAEVAVPDWNDSSAPELSEGTFISRDPSTGHVSFRSNEAGTYAYIVAVTDPGPAAIKASANTDDMVQGLNTIDLVGLPTTATSVWIMGKDETGNWSAPIHIELPTTGVALSVVSATRDSITKGTVTFTSDSDATVYLLSKLASQQAPQPDELKALPVANQMTVQATATNTINVTTVGGDPVNVYMIAQDSAGNWSTMVVGNIPAIDKTPPTISASAGERLTSADYRFAVTTDLNATLHYVAVPAGQPEPKEEAIMASTASESIVVGIANVVSANGLTSADAVTVYAMASTHGSDGEDYWSPVVTVDIPVFAETDPIAVSNVSVQRTNPTSGSLTFSVDKPGYVVAILLPAEESEPSLADFEAAVTDDDYLAHSGAQTVTIPGLSETTSQKVYLRAYYTNAKGETVWSNMGSATVPAFTDVTPPDLSDGQVIDREATTAQVSFRSNEAGTYAYIVSPTEKTASEIKASSSTGTMSQGMTTIDAIPVTADATSVWIAGWDATGNLSNVVEVKLAAVDVDVTAPTLTNGAVVTRDATTGKVTFDSNEAGQYAYKVATTDPGEAAIKAEALAPMNQGSTTINLSGLTPDATTVWIMGKDAAGNWSTPPLSVPLDKVDEDGPVLTNGTISNRTATTATVSFTAPEAGAYAYMVSVSNPGDVTVQGKPTTPMISETNTFNIAGLTADATNVWIVAKDANDNWGPLLNIPVQSIDVTAPTLANVTSSARTATTATVTFTASEVGQYGYLVGVTEPDTDALKTAATTPMVSGTNTINLTELTSSATSVWIIGKDASGNWSAVAEAKLAGVDVTAPTLNDGQVITREAYTGKVSFRSNEAGTYAYIVAPSDPGATAIKDSDSTGTMSQGMTTIDGVNLTPAATSVWIMGKDAAGNWSASPIEIKLAAVDVQAPTLTDGKIVVRDPHSVRVSFNSDEVGTYAYVVALSDPGATAIKDSDSTGTMNHGVTAIDSTVTADATSVWIMGKDAAGNWSNTIEIKLPAVDDKAPTLTQGKVISRTANAVSVTFTSDEAGQYTAMAATTNPGNDLLSALPSGTMAASSNIANLTELPASATSVWIVGKDAAGNASTIMEIPVGAYVPPTGPALSSPQVLARVADSATVTFQSSSDGKYAYVVAPTNPGEAAIKATKQTDMDEGTNTINLTGLTPAATAVWIMGQNSDGVWSSVLQIPLAAVDVKAPALTAGSVTARTGSTATASFTSDEAGQYGYVVSATYPGSDALRAATTRPMTAGVTLIDLTGLTADATVVWFMAMDAAGNWSDGTQLSIPAVDVTAPSLTNGKVESRQATTARISFTSNESGTYAYIVSATDPGVDAIKTSGSKALMLQGTTFFNLNTLTTAATSVWIMGMDTSNNWSEPLRVQIPSVTVPVADPVKNTFSVEDGLIQTAGVPFTITANGHRQSEAGAIVGEQRYIPMTASANPTVSFSPNAGVYTASMTIPNPGSYTLAITYQLQQWNGTSWSNVQGQTDTKSAALTVVPVPDTDAPNLSGATQSGRTATTATVGFTSNEAGTYAYIVRPASQQAPDAIDLQLTPDSTGNMAAGTNSIALSGLSAVATNVYVAGKDAAGNWSTIMTIPLAAVDVTAPVLSSGQVSARTDTTATVSFRSNEAGTYAYIVAATDPGAAAIKAATPSPLISSTNTINLTGLTTAATNVWIMSKDAAGNWSDVMQIAVAKAGAVPQANSNNNKWTIDGGNTQTAGVSFQITATGDRQDATGTIVGEQRYVPRTAATDATSAVFSLANGKYITSMTIATEGSPTLTVTYQLQEWNGTAWVDVAGVTNPKSNPITINPAPTQEPTDTPTSTPTDTPTSTPTDTPTSTPTDTPTSTPTSTPTATPTVAPTQTPTSAPTHAPSTSPKAPLGGGVATGSSPWVLVVALLLSSAGVVLTRRLIHRA